MPIVRRKEWPYASACEARVGESRFSPRLKHRCGSMTRDLPIMRRAQPRADQVYTPVPSEVDIWVGPVDSTAFLRHPSGSVLARQRLDTRRFSHLKFLTEAQDAKPTPAASATITGTAKEIID